jgi:hypothetical protein
MVVTGTRFVHTSEGRFLVTRLVLCPRCVAASQGDTELAQHQHQGSDSWGESSVPSGALAPRHVAEVKGSCPKCISYRSLQTFFVTETMKNVKFSSSTTCGCLVCVVCLL